MTAQQAQEITDASIASLVVLYEQITLLADKILQSQPALDLITADKVGDQFFWKERAIAKHIPTSFEM